MCPKQRPHFVWCRLTLGGTSYDDLNFRVISESDSCCSEPNWALHALLLTEVKTIPDAWPSDMNTCGRIAAEPSAVRHSITNHPVKQRNRLSSLPGSTNQTIQAIQQHPGPGAQLWSFRASFQQRTAQGRRFAGHML